MKSLLLGSSLAMCLIVTAAVSADTKDAKDTKDKKKAEATITKVDAKAGTITVRMKDKKDGKEVEKTFKLTETLSYFDSTGKVVAADVFTAGDEVLVLEEEGQLKEMKQTAKAGTVHEGTLVTASEGKLTIEGKDKKEYSHMVAKDAKISCDGKDCKVSDLKKGAKVKIVTDGKGEDAKITRIDAMTK